ncbi:MAG: carbohydrate ABC transporter permease [Clostridia bacterium]|nr:carbohydrate ABC transporter permease [Clostridia bacterium]
MTNIEYAELTQEQLENMTDEEIAEYNQQRKKALEDLKFEEIQKKSKAANRYAKFKKTAFPIVKVIFLLELSFIILFPLISQLCSTFMSVSDLSDPTVEFIPMSPTIEHYQNVMTISDYWTTLLMTVVICLIVAVCTMYSASLIGYGFAKFNFKGKNFLFLLVIITIIIPPATILLPMFTKFRFFDFDFLGLIKLFTGKGIYQWIDALLISGDGVGEALKLTNSIWPLILLSITGFGFRGGLFIFLMRQFYRGVPNELSEASYVDGAGVFRTYFSVIHPLGKSLRVTIFLLSFSWQWTDTFYSGMFFSTSYEVMANVLTKAQGAAETSLSNVYTNTATMLILIPLLIIFAFGQNLMAEGIERSGIVG